MTREAESTRAADIVVQAIEDDILGGNLNEGMQLPPERDLMMAHGVSRTVVREAVQILSARGLLEARPRHRPIVRKPGYDAVVEAVQNVANHLLQAPEGLQHLHDTRILIEAGLVREAALRAGKDDIQALRAALDANEAAIEDSVRFYQTDAAFHGVFYRMSDNPLLPAIHRAFGKWLSPHWLRMPDRPDRNMRNHQDHRAIYDAVLMRDPDAAETALRGHLGEAWRDVRLTFDDS